MKMLKIFCAFTIFLSVLTGFSTISATADSPSFSVPAKAAIAIDADTGQILYSQNADEADLGIASITKLITIYLTYQEIAQGKLSRDEKVPISDYAYAISVDPNASGVPFKQGESYSVRDLVDAALVPSSNAAAIALAEKISGSEPNFVLKMQALLQSWGIKDAKLYTASGFPYNLMPAPYQQTGALANVENTMSAKDVVEIAEHLLKTYPQVLDITKQPQMTFDQGGASQAQMKSTDYMLPGLNFYRAGVDGLKTGSTNFAGSCFVATTVENGYRVISVVLDADGGLDNDGAGRFTATNILLNGVYTNWKLVPANSLKLKKTVTVKNAANISNPISIKSTKEILVSTSAKLLPTYKFSIFSGLTAPIFKGSSIGNVQLAYPGSSYISGYSAPDLSLTVKSNVKKASVWVSFERWLSSVF